MGDQTNDPDPREILGSPVDPSRDLVLPNIPVPKRAQFERFGFHFGVDLAHDPLFVHGSVPLGWRREAECPPWLTFIRDERGRLRAWLVYNTVPGRRYAELNMQSRLRICLHKKRGVYLGVRGVGERTFQATVVYDEDRVLWEGPDLPPRRRERRESCYNRARETAKHWLDEHFPHWRDPAAYWELEFTTQGER